VVVLDRATGRLSLEKGDKHGMSNVKLSPGARVTLLDDDAIPAIPMRAIHAFLTQPRVVGAGELDRAPFVLGSNDDEKVVLGVGDDAFATGGPAGVARWTLLRPGKPLTDPETGEALGVEVEYLGDAQTVIPGAPQKIRITRSAQEILPKDKLVEAEDFGRFEYVPRAPDSEIRGRIVSAYGGISESGLYQTVLINRGANDGLEPGHVLAVYREGLAVPLSREQTEQVTWVADQAGVPDGGAWLYNDVRCLKQGSSAVYSQANNVKDSFRNTCLTATRKNLVSSNSDSVQLPDARSGLLMVYRVFDRVAYALIMQSEGPVYLLDAVRNP
jgi:hypothetical protein